MGRRAKYLTLVEKQAARRIQHQTYAQTSKGRQQRAVQNRAAYIRRRAQADKAQTDAWTVEAPNRLPPSLIALAKVPLPDSRLFHSAAHSADEVDESELVHWDKDPPYLQPEPANTPEEERFTRNLTDVMFGRWTRLEIDARTRRERRYHAGERQGLILDLHQAATKAFVQWEQLNGLIVTMGNGRRHKEVAESLLRWRARTAYFYRIEAAMINTGKDPY